MDHTQAKDRIEFLRREIERHNRLYYVAAAPEISDREYDALFRELCDLETAHPELRSPDSPSARVGGEPLSEFAPVRHAVPMLSLDNTYSEAEIRAFDTRVREWLGGEAPLYVVEPKVDGVAVSLRYESGRLVLAATRGDGETGDDVTANLRTLRGLPLRLPTRAAVLEFRGEVYLTRQEFDRINAERQAAGLAAFANPRNSTAGSLKLLDAREVAKRRLSLVLYGQGDIDGEEISSQRALLALFERLGLPGPRRHWLCRDAEELLAAIRELDATRRGFPYDTDGAVIKVDDFAQRERLGLTARAPRWATAFKYPPEQARTRLRAISIQVGRSGVLTPVAELEPVFLAGSTISRATLHNEDEIRRKDIRPGDMVLIEKAGEVIPAVVSVVREERPEGTVPFDLSAHLGGRCPVCGGPIARDPEFVAWRCQNLACPAQKTRRLEYFARRDALDLEGIGGIVADKLVESGLVDEPLDLFALAEERMAALNLGTAEAPRVFGAKNAARVRQALERARTLPLARWLVALAIPEIGESAAHDLAGAHADLEAVAVSPILRDLRDLAEWNTRAAEVNPRSRSNKPTDGQEQARRAEEYAALKTRIADAEKRLIDSGFARPGASGVVAPVGPVAAASVLEFFASPAGQKLLARLRELGIRPQGEAALPGVSADGPLAGKTVVITGTLSQPRGWFEEKIRAAGGRASGSVSAKTDYLLAGEAAGSKLEKARALGVKIIDEAAFLQLLGPE